MAKKRQMICDCGGYFSEEESTISNIKVPAMVCNSCKHITLTQNQAEQFVRLKELHDIIDSERKIIQIGSSMGLTLPEKLRKTGISVGKKIRLEVLDLHSFKIEIEK